MNDNHDADDDHQGQIDDLLESIAQFDRDENTREQAGEEPRFEFDEPSEEWMEAVTQAALEASEAPEVKASEAPEPVPASAANEPPNPGRWRLWIGAAAALVLAVGTVALLSLEAPAPVEIGPCSLQLGGTARMLGSAKREPGTEKEPPRRYGPSDKFVLRVVPTGQDLADVEIAVEAVAQTRRVPLRLKRRVGADGAIELFETVADQLEIGVWALHVWVGTCDPQRPAPTCRELETHVEIVAD